MNISYEGIDQVCITMRKKGEIKVGDACSAEGNNTVAISADEQLITGVAAAVRGEYVSVIIRGIVTLPYTGSAPGVGYCPLVGDGNGGVKYLLDGINYHVLEVNTSAHTVTFIL